MSEYTKARNYRAEATVFEQLSSAQLIGSALSLIGEDIRVAAALDIEAAIQLRIKAETDRLRERVKELEEALTVIVGMSSVSASELDWPKLHAINEKARATLSKSPK